MIRIGSSPITPAQLLMELWSKVQTLYPNIKFQIVPFENTPENAREILANLGKNIDVVGGIFDDTMLDVRACAGLELIRGPFHCAASIHHRLAAKDRLQLSDLYGENLLLMHRGWSHYVDRLRDDLWQNHPQIHIVDFDFYNMNIFNRCENTNDVLLAIPGWANVHPLLKAIPMDWNHSIPYGILHSPTPSPVVQHFLDVAKEVRKEIYDRFIETCSLTNRAIFYFENVEFLDSINLFHKAEKNIDAEMKIIDEKVILNTYYGKIKEVVSLYILFIQIINSLKNIFIDNITKAVKYRTNFTQSKFLSARRKIEL